MAGFVGVWEAVSYENFEAYMDTVGVPDEVRRLLKEKHTMTMSNDGDKWQYKTTYGDNSNVVNLVVGTFSDYETPTRTPMKGMIKSLSDSKIVEEHFIGDAGLRVDTVRELVNGQLCISPTVKGVTAKFLFKKV